MKKILYVLLTSSLLFSGAAVALADSQTLNFFCDLYTQPFVSDGLYNPIQGGTCAYTLPAIASSSIEMTLYKGTPGNALPIKFDNVVSPQAPAMQQTFGNSFGSPPVGTDFFAVAYGYDSFGEVFSADTYFQSGEGAAPLSYFILPFKWGTPLSVTSDDKTINAGDPMPAFTITLDGFASGDTRENSVTGSPDCTTTASDTSVVGNYEINCAQGTLSSAKYSFSPFYSGTLHISATQGKSSSVTTITCPADIIYNGSAQTPCTATATGAGGLNQSLVVIYTNNTSAGAAQASASFGGDSTHTGSSDSEEFLIGKADATCSLTGYSGMYDAGAHGATGSCAGVGSDGVLYGLSLGDTFTSALGGIAHWTFTENTNYTGQSGDVSIAILQAPSATTLNCPTSTIYSGLPQTPCAATATGVGGLNQPLTVSYSNNTGPGVAQASASFAGDINHTGSSAGKNFTIMYRWDGFLQPINDTAHQIGQNLSVFKAGSTVPVKLQLKNAAGTVVQAAAAPLWSAPILIGPMSTPVDELTYTEPATSGSYFKWDGSQYQYNWSTKGLAAGNWYRIYAVLDDGTVQSVVIGLR